MKKIIICLLLVVLLSSLASAGFDYTISDTYEYGIFQLNGESLQITGSGAYQVDAKGTSYIEAINTAPLRENVGGIYTLGLDDSSTMNFYGGEMGGFRIYDDAKAVFSGGSINYISSYQFSDMTKHITFICDVASVEHVGNLLTGDWLDGTSFSITLQDQSGYDSVFSNINFIPEPMTFALLSIGVLALRRNKTPILRHIRTAEFI